MRDYINELSKDWLDRNGTTFVHKRKSQRLGWEDTLKPGQGYSSFLLESPTEMDLLKRSYPLARNIIAAMDTPWRVNVKLTKNGSYTNGKTIYVATNVFDEEEIETGRKLDIFLGYTVHEGAHVLYTDFKDNDYLNGLDGMDRKWVSHIANIIEDEYIERQIGDQKPGLCNFLEATKWYAFGRYDKELEKKETEAFVELVNAFLYLVRYPKNLTEELIETYGEYLLEARDILTPYPSCTRESNEAALKIYDIFKKFIKESVKDSLAGNPGLDMGEEDPDSEERELDCDDDTEVEIDFGGTDDEDDNPEDTGSETEGGSAKKIKISLSPSSGEGKEIKISPRLQEKINDAIRSLLEKELDKMSSALDAVAPDRNDGSDPDRNAGIINENDYNSELIEGTLEEGDAKLVFFRQGEEQRDIYDKAYQEIRPYIKDIRNSIKSHFKEYRLVHHCQKSGKLETRKLAEAYLGTKTVYVRRGEVNTDKIAVCVLVDESGSMGYTRSKAARETAILLNEALSGIPDVELFIYGHTGDEIKNGSTEIIVYKDKKHNSRFALGDIQARSENRDGLAILETAKRVRKQTARPVLMFILSDGSPCASNYYGNSAIRDTKKKVEQVEAMGFIPVQICINANYDPALMFKNYLFLTDMNSLSVELSKTIKEALRRNTRSHII